MSQNRSRRHHYVPEMLSKNFWDGNCKLQFFEKSTGLFDERTPYGVFWQPHLNTRFVDGGKRGDWSAETKLGKLENVAAPVLKKDYRRVRLWPFAAVDETRRCRLQPFLRTYAV